MNDAAGGNGCGKREGHSPEIERQILIPGQSLADVRQNPSYRHSRHKRQEKQRKHLAENQSRRTPCRHARMRMHKRHQSRNQQCGGEIDQHCISGNIANIAAEFAGDDRAGSGRRADQAYHRSFKHDAQIALRHGDQYAADACEKSALYEQKPQMPFAKPELAGIDLTEGEKKHREYECGLDKVYRLAHKLMCTVEKGDACIREISQNASQHGDYQSPVLKKTNNFHMRISKQTQNYTFYTKHHSPTNFFIAHPVPKMFTETL